MSSLTLVIPTYNEAHRWKAAYWEDLLLLDYVRWIFVDDGSTDSSYERLMELNQHSRCQVLRLPSNQGKGEAVRAGMNHFFNSNYAKIAEGTGPVVNGDSMLGFMDADGSIEKADIIRLAGVARSRIDFADLSAKNDDAGKVDAVWSSRVGLNGRRIQRRLSRHYLGRIINSLLGFHISHIPYDPQCGFKIFSPSLRLKASLEEPFKTRWFFDLEIILNWEKANQSHIRIWEEPLDSWQEISGSHLSFRNSFRIAREMAYVAIHGRRASRGNKRGIKIGS